MPVDWEVPFALKRLNKAPNVELLEAGDVLLFSPLKPNFVQRLIQRSQGGYPLQDARWTHVSVIFDRERLVEAVTPRVRCGTVYDQATSGLIRARRAVGLSPGDRLRVAVEVLSELGSGYSRAYAFSIGWGNLLPSRRQRSFKPHPRAVICSQLFSDAFARATGQSIVPGKLSKIVPADLSRTSMLQDVQFGWVPLQ